MKALGILLCYNDGDMLEDAINHLLENNHDLIVWDHGSDDETPSILDRYRFIERKYIPRSFDFYNLYQTMSKNIIENYRQKYDWISWPDQDEILEGPDRKKSYFEHVEDVFKLDYNYIRFENFNYWFTEKDDLSIVSPVKRIRYYSIFSGCSPRIRSWRANVTNIRVFNHNYLEGKKYPKHFVLKHYSMRCYEQMMKRLKKDRVNLSRKGRNFHYEIMLKDIKKLLIKSDDLYFDDGKEDLLRRVKFDWKSFYGL